MASRVASADTRSTLNRWPLEPLLIPAGVLVTLLLSLLIVSYFGFPKTVPSPFVDVALYAVLLIVISSSLALLFLTRKHRAR